MRKEINMSVIIDENYYAECKKAGFLVEGDGVLRRYVGHDSIIHIPEGIKYISSFAFSDNLDIDEVYIPDSVTTIDGMAFRGCLNLRYVDLGSGVTEILTEAFRCCYSLRSIVLPRNVRSVQMFAFEECISLEEVVIQNPGICFENLLSIFFWSDNLKVIYAPEGLELDESKLPKGCQVLRLGSIIIENQQGEK